METIVQIWGIVITSIFSIVALVVSVYTFYKTNKESTYADLDTLYLEILKIGMDNPQFRNPELTSDYKKSFEGKELVQYEIYANMAWNVCETIVDREGKGSETWKPVIDAENKLHKSWFNSDENRKKFKNSFVEHIISLK